MNSLDAAIVRIGCDMAISRCAASRDPAGKVCEQVLGYAAVQRAADTGSVVPHRRRRESQ